jgi:hypothetical protein
MGICRLEVSGKIVAANTRNGAVVHRMIGSFNKLVGHGRMAFAAKLQFVID